MSEEIAISKPEAPQFGDLIRFVNNLNDETPIRPKCQLCNSRWKKDAHEEYERTL